MKKLFLIFLFLPLLAISQQRLDAEEFFYMHRHADSTNETNYCRQLFDEMNTAWGVDCVDSVRLYADSIYLHIATDISNSRFTIYNQYGSVVTISSEIAPWTITVSRKLAHNLKQYNSTPSINRGALKENFVNFARGHVYIRWYK